MFDVAGRVVIVTGGLGQLGRQYVLALLDRGAHVAVFDVGVGDARVAAQYGARAQDPNLLIVDVDVTSRASIEAGTRTVEERLGVPYGLVNNAALDSPPDSPASETGPFENYPEASFDRVMDVNVKGVFLCMQVVGGRMAEAGRGSIVNISSIYGLVSPNQSLYEYRRTAGESFYKPVAYAASKSALFNLTRYAATYWARAGVRVNTLTLAGVFNNQDERFIRAYGERMPMTRMAREDEYNGAVVFLLSDASSYMTGSNLVVDGGWTAW
jgi:NAD(P)-dependent dehydrogenase (short-subunit alcohol dehydrogenase family)